MTLRNIKIKEENTCFHCGEKIHNGDIYLHDDEGVKYFCCNGCLQAYKIIHDLGFEKYYDTRTELPDKPEENFVEETVYLLIDGQIPTQTDKKGNYFKEGKFYIKGLHCASCVWVNEKVLNSIEGVLEAYVQLSTNRVYLKWDPQKVNLYTLAKATSQIGYPILPIDESKESKVKIKSDDVLKKMAIAGFFMGNNMMISVALYAGYLDYIDLEIKQYFHWISMLLTTPVFFYSASDFFKSGYYSLKNKVLGTDLLTATGLSLSYFYSVYITIFYQVEKEVFFDAINFVVFAILTGRFIESRIKLKTLYFTSDLSSQKPPFVRVFKNYNYLQIINNKIFINESIQKIKLEEKQDYEFKKIEEIHEEEIIVVPPNELVPLDSLLLNPSAELDEASVTGEFRPILKKYNDFIISGSKNINNFYLFLKVLKRNEESTITKILKMAEDSLKQKSKAENLGNQAASIFVFLVLVLGFFTFIYWYYYKNNLSNAILYTLSLLIVACPCALSLSIPTAIIVGLQKAFSNGCLIHNTSLFEVISKSKVIAFDKTGTITKGNLTIEKIITILNQNKILDIIKNLNQFNRELKIQHPITSSFYKWEDQHNHSTFFINELNDKLKSIAIKEAIYHPGKGIEYLLKNGDKLFLGSNEWLRENNFINHIIYNFQEETGNVIVALGWEHRQKEIIAFFVLRDELKEDVQEVIDSLNKDYTTILLTGDKKENAEYIQKETKIQEIYYSLKPEEKGKIIKNFQKKWKVIMVGDGINDTIALKQADVGISFAEASKLALYSADVLFLNNNLNQIQTLIQLSKLVMRKIKQNLLMSLVYNTILLPLAFLGYLSPFLGSIFMSLSSITVVLNSLSIAKNYQKR